MRIADLYAETLINPSRGKFIRFLKDHGVDYARAAIDAEGDLYICEPYHQTHHDLKTGHDLKISQDEILSLSPLYVFRDHIGARLNVTDNHMDEFLDYSELARQNRNIVRLYGKSVQVVDYHREP